MCDYPPVVKPSPFAVGDPEDMPGWDDEDEVEEELSLEEGLARWRVG